MGLCLRHYLKEGAIVFCAEQVLWKPVIQPLLASGCPSIYLAQAGSGAPATTGSRLLSPRAGLRGRKGVVASSLDARVRGKLTAVRDAAVSPWHSKFLPRDPSLFKVWI